MSNYLDWSFIKDNFSNSLEFYDNLCEKQLKEFESREEDFKTAITNNNRTEIKKICHYFKSSFGNLGWSSALRALNKLSKGSEIDNLNLGDLYNELLTEIVATKEALSEQK